MLHRMSWVLGLAVTGWCLSLTGPAVDAGAAERLEPVGRGPHSLASRPLLRLSQFDKAIRGERHMVSRSVLVAAATRVPFVSQLVRLLRSEGREVLVARRADALEKIRRSENFAALSVAAKRIKNILRQAEYTGGATVRPELLEPGPEQPPT